MSSRGSLRGPSSRDGAASEAVSDVVGSILMVGITVGMTVVLAILLMVYQGPQPSPHADLAITVLPGAGGWGTGDETVRVRHLGGDAVPSSAHVVVAVGAATTDLTGAALGGPFADGRLAVGESWSRAWTIRSTDAVTVDVVTGGSGPSHLLATLTLLPQGAGP